jgi:hypothetical protein
MMETPPLGPPTRRVTESPLAYIRTSAAEFEPDGFSLTEEPTGPTFQAFFQNMFFFSEEALAVLNAVSGTRYRQSVYGLLPMMDHEQFDSIGIRRTRSFFSVEPLGTGGSLAVPRMDSSAYVQRCYVLRLSNAMEPVGTISLQHVVEELLERCRFLRNPAVAWICRPHKLHVLLAMSNATNVVKEKRRCARIVNSCCGPIELRLHRLVWKREGTLWAQWHCVRGNIDRLRADLRIASNGVLGSSPFSIETLVLAVLQKPNQMEYEEIQKITQDMQRMFEGVCVSFNSVSRVAQIHDQFERDGMDETEIALAPARISDGSFVDQLSFAWYLVRTSPSVRRIAGMSTLSVLGGICLFYAIRRFK